MAGLVKAALLILGLALLAGVVGIALRWTEASPGLPEDQQPTVESSATPVQPVPTAPVDIATPTHTETATFALG